MVTGQQQGGLPEYSIRGVWDAVGHQPWQVQWSPHRLTATHKHDEYRREFGRAESQWCVWNDGKTRVDCLLQEPLVVVVNSHLVKGLLSHSQLPVKRGHGKMVSMNSNTQIDTVG